GLCTLGRASLDANFRRRAIAETAVRALRVVLPAPLLDQDPRLAQVGEVLGVQALAPERRVEALDAAVLPRLAGCDGRGLAVVHHRPHLQHPRDELGAVV